MNTVKYIEFPPVTAADKDGLLAMGGDLSIDTLLSAYQQGIFPWFSEGQPVLWWSPDPRMVLKPKEIKISRSLCKKIRQHRFQVTCDQDFSSVIKHCALRGQKSNANQIEANETWITQSMKDAYTNLYQQGYAHSIE
ncbi:MAG: leucyl/phenylalanyl-tRNA--protein transferase, partial [Acidiferrobacterales bacterium]|nr:leucyl/phenylalanyl-tRNA--protein transferase [Acidiferrobacterales bacterium]